jgi:hypothetical protein
MKMSLTGVCLVPIINAQFKNTLHQKKLFIGLKNGEISIISAIINYNIFSIISIFTCLKA